VNGSVVALGSPGGAESWGEEAKPRVGFFTDTSICIGCKACEVACKEWNDVPADNLGLTGTSYDNSAELGPNRWRHVAFIEQRVEIGGVADGMPDSLAEEAARQQLVERGLDPHDDPADGFRWLMSSDVCKHCTDAGCLDGCPTGSIFRTEHGTVVVQEDICNGCGYCVTACPFGVLQRREDDGRVWKCTLCYDRLQDDLTPACAQACPTQSIKFGPLEELRERAAERVETLHERGAKSARLYLHEGDDGVGGAGAFFLLLDEPETYGLPPDPVDPTSHRGEAWRAVGAAACALGAGVLASFAGRRR
jgi:formate dehydrogenase iron-sulfur subunit